MQNAATVAVVYVPAGHPIDRIFWRAWAYIQRRGYRLYEVVRSMDHAVADLDAGEAQVVLMMAPEREPRADPEATTVIDLRAKRDRMLANEPTVRLRPSANQILDDTASRWANESAIWRRRMNTSR